MRRLARDVLLMALATGVSRVFGLFRDVAIADRFGMTAAYDAFLIAFFVPHFLRQLLAEGALSTAFVPVYTGLRIGGEGSDRFASNLLSWLALLFPITVVAGILIAPSYVPFLASGFSGDKLALATMLTRVVLPFIALIGFASVFMGVLNAHHRFFAAALAPVWFNVGMILGVLLIAPRFPQQPVLGLAIGTLVGGAGQLLSQIPALARVGFRFRFSLLPLHPGIRRLLRLMGPAVLALAVTQVNLLVDNKMASHLSDGGISSLQYGMRLFQLPLGVFAVSVATALLPRFSAAWANRDEIGFSSYLRDGVVTSALVLLPAMAGLLIIGSDVIRLLFQHGSFTAIDTLRTSRVLGFYMIGLLPYGWVYVFTRAFYALGRTLVPLIASVVAVTLNVVLDLCLVSSMQEAGLALATAIAGVGSALLLGAFLWPRLRKEPRALRELGLITIGCLALSAAAFLVRWGVGDRSPALAVFAPLVTGVLVYAAYVRFTPLWSLVVSLRTEWPRGRGDDPRNS
ncbi:MAG: murein biosynthesis integral membrane protein MurJ [Candidatus Bipolaricaulia bacterium]